MENIYLIVNRISYPYVKNITDYIYSQLKAFPNSKTEFHLCSHVNEVDFDENSFIFIIGEHFKIFNRKITCKYIFLNFSVIYMIGSIFNCSLSAYREIKRKRNLLMNKLKCLDYVLDYWPTQTKIMETKIPIPVKSYPVGIEAISPDKIPPISARKYDVCFVGALTPRREKIIKKLESKGIVFSPHVDINLEEAALESKIVLNIHSRRSNHLESPRIVGAFATRAAVVSEYCDQINAVFPHDTCITSRYSDLPSQIVKLLADTDKIERFAGNGYSWLSQIHTKNCDSLWRKLLCDIMHKS